MVHRDRSLLLWLLVIASLTASSARAENVCDETVPAERHVDGIPAYAQCSASSSSAIYTNGGVDTRTASGGAGWVQTQSSGGYQCTEFARRYLRFRWQITGGPYGTAKDWCSVTLPAGVEISAVPVHGDVLVQGAGVCGASAESGHVAVVDVVNANSTITVVEQNSAARRTRAITCALCFLHVTANDGQPADGGDADRVVTDAARDSGGTDAGRDAIVDDAWQPGTDGGAADTARPIDAASPVDTASPVDAARPVDAASSGDTAGANDARAVPDSAAADTAGQPDAATASDRASGVDGVRDATGDAVDTDAISDRPPVDAPLADGAAVDAAAGAPLPAAVAEGCACGPGPRATEAWRTLLLGAAIALHACWRRRRATPARNR